MTVFSGFESCLAVFFFSLFKVVLCQLIRLSCPVVVLFIYSLQHICGCVLWEYVSYMPVMLDADCKMLTVGNAGLLAPWYSCTATLMSCNLYQLEVVFKKLFLGQSLSCLSFSYSLLFVTPSRYYSPPPLSLHHCVKEWFNRRLYHWEWPSLKKRGSFGIWAAVFFFFLSVADFYLQ